MGAFDVAIERLDGQPVVVLNDVARGRRVRIASHGACVLSLEVKLGGRWIDLADGHRDASELATRPGSRFALLAPFANRVAQARYRFDGVEHDLAPDASGASRASRHGFARDADFVVASLDADAAGAHLLLAARLQPQPGYPFALDLTACYTLAADGLSLTIGMRNLGEKAAPAFAGWHPYFRLGGGPLATWELSVPAGCVIATDADFIPLPGAAAYRALDEIPELDFRRPRAIDGRALNHTFAGLLADADGRIRSRLRDPASGMAIAVWQERGVLLAYTGDTLERGARTSLALEPMESLPDAFNRPDCVEAIRLEPGAARAFRCGVEIHLP